MAVNVDPVCGYRVTEEVARDDGLTSEYSGQTFFFCCEKCKTAFEADPQGVLKIHEERMAQEKTAPTN